jgi:hypothetical protein
MQDNVIAPPQSGHGERVIWRESAERIDFTPSQARRVPSVTGACGLSKASARRAWCRADFKHQQTHWVEFYSNMSGDDWSRFFGDFANPAPATALGRVRAQSGIIPSGTGSARGRARVAEPRRGGCRCQRYRKRSGDNMRREPTQTRSVSSARHSRTLPWT